MVLIYIPRFIVKKILFDFIEKKYVQSITAYFLKACTFSSFERFHRWKSRNYFQYFSLDIIVEVFLYHTKRKERSIWFVFYLSFFSFFLFFFFYRYFPWQIITIHRMAENRQVIIIFHAFHFQPLTNIHNQTYSWYDLLSLEICILFAFWLMQLSWSDIVRILAHFKLLPFYYTKNALTNWDLQP